MAIQYLEIFGGFHKWGYFNSWMVFFLREIPIYKWMMTGGIPSLGNLHLLNIKQDTQVDLVETCAQDCVAAKSPRLASRQLGK